jgi:hypothetical protein
MTAKKYTAKEVLQAKKPNNYVITKVMITAVRTI